MKITYKNTELLKRLDERIILKDVEGIWDPKTKVLRLYFMGPTEFPGLVRSTSGDEIFELSLESGEEICSKGNIVYIEFPEDTLADISTSRWSGSIEYLESSGYAIGANILRELGESNLSNFIELDSWYRYYRVSRAEDYRNLRRLDEDGKIISQDYYFYDYINLYLLASGADSENTTLYDFNFYNDPTIQLYGYALRNVYRKIGNTETKLGKELVSLQDVPGLELHESAGTTPNLVSALSTRDLQVRFDHFALIGVGIRNAEFYVSAWSRDGKEIRSNILRFTEARKEDDWKIISKTVFTEEGNPIFLFQHDDASRGEFRTIKIETSYDELSMDDLNFESELDDYFYRRVRIEPKNEGSYIIIDVRPKVDNSDTVWIPRVSGDTPRSCTLTCHGYTLTYYAAICPNLGDLNVVNSSEEFVSRIGLPGNGLGGVYTITSPHLSGQYWRGLRSSEDIIISTPWGITKPGAENIEITESETNTEPDTNTNPDSDSDSSSTPRLFAPRLMRAAANVAIEEDYYWDDLRDGDPGNLSRGGGGGGGGSSSGGSGGGGYGNNTTSNKPALNPDWPDDPLDPILPDERPPMLISLGDLALKVGERVKLYNENVSTWRFSDDDSYKGIISLLDDEATLVAEGVGAAQVYGNSTKYSNKTYYYNVTVAPLEESSKTGDFMITTFVENTDWYGIDIGSAIVVNVNDEEIESESFPDDVLGENWRNITTRAFRELPVIKYGAELQSEIIIQDYLEDKASESEYASEVLSGNTEEYDYIFPGLGVYKVEVTANFPVRFKTESDLIPMSPYGRDGSNEYTTTNGIVIHVNDGDRSAENEWAITQFFYIRLDTVVYEPTLVTINYDCADGRAVEPGIIRIMILPPMPKIIQESDQAILIIKNNIRHYNQDFYFRSYSRDVTLSVDYLRSALNQESWTPNSVNPLNYYPGVSIKMDGGIKWDTKSGHTGTRALRGYFTINSITGLDTSFPAIKPACRIKLKSGNNTVYYYVYLLPPAPRNELSTTIPIDKDEYLPVLMIYDPGIFLLPKGDLDTAVWDNGVRFRELSVTANMNVWVSRSNPGGAFNGVFIDNKASINVDWTGSNAAWASTKVGASLGTLTLNWKGSEIADIDKLIDTKYLNKIPANPYQRTAKIYRQTIRFVKQEIVNTIAGVGSKTEFGAEGTYDPSTGNPGYEDLRMTGSSFSTGANSPNTMYEYPIRKLETENSSRYDILVFPGTTNFRLTIYPRYGEKGSSYSLDDSSIQNLLTSSYGKFSIYEVKKTRENSSSEWKTLYENSIVDFEFTQSGFREGIVLNDRLYVGKCQGNVVLSPNIRYDTTSISVSAYAAQLTDVIRGRDNVGGDIEVKILENGFEKSSISFHNEKVLEIPLSANTGTERKIYQIQFIHVERTPQETNILHLVTGIVTQECNAWRSEMPNRENYYVYSYGSMNMPVEFNTMIPLRNIKIVEVDSEGNEIPNSGLQVGRVRKKRDILGEDDSLESVCYTVSLKFSPNSMYPDYREEDPDSWKRSRYIMIRNANIDGSIFEFKQGYYTILPKYSDPEPVYFEDRWILGTSDNQLIIPSYRNTPRVEYRVLIPFNYVRKEITDTVERKINVKDLITAGILEIDESDSSTTLYSAAEYYGDKGGLDTDGWFRSIETDIITESTDESIELPALETVYTVSSAGFIERDVIAKEVVSLKSGILDDNGKPLYDMGNLVIINSKIQIWYRKIGEDLKDE